MEKWFAFKAYNKGTLYGYGTAEDAERYCDAHNVDKEIDLLAAHEMTEAEAAEHRLDQRDDAFNLDDELRARADEIDTERWVEVEDDTVAPGI